MNLAAPLFIQCCKVLRCCAPSLPHHRPPFRGGAGAARRCGLNRSVRQIGEKTLLLDPAGSELPREAGRTPSPTPQRQT